MFIFMQGQWGEKAKPKISMNFNAADDNLVIALNKDFDEM